MSLWYFCSGMSSRLLGDGCRDLGAYTWAPKYCCLSGHCSAEHRSGSPLGPSAAEAGSLVKLCRGNMYFMWLNPLLWKLGIGPNFLLAVPFLCATLPSPPPRLLSISKWHIWVGASWASVQHIILVLPCWLPSVISQGCDRDSSGDRYLLWPSNPPLSFPPWMETARRVLWDLGFTLFHLYKVKPLLAMNQEVASLIWIDRAVLEPQLKSVRAFSVKSLQKGFSVLFNEQKRRLSIGHRRVARLKLPAARTSKSNQSFTGP